MALAICFVGGWSGDRSASGLVDAAPATDWYAIQYSKVPGCGFYVQYFDRKGTEATDKSKRIAFFPGGAAPDITSEACVRYCAQWEELGIIDIVRRSYQHRLGLTHVTGTCYLRGERVSGPRTIWRDVQR